MSSLQAIQSSIKEDLKKFEEYFKSALQSEIPLLSKIVNYVLRTKGKRVRPMLVFLSAKICGQINDKTYIGATSVELLHSATLIHDDIVDESYERRGFFTVNALWKNKISVLIGDFIMARWLLLNLNNDNINTKFLQYTSRSVQDMTEGEIIQINTSRNPDFLFDTYYDIIGKKTASLMASCMAIGALSVNADDEVIEKMYQIGLNIGLAFQIKDDIFDYQDKGILGKPVGNDLREQKITLPLLYVLQNFPPGKEKRKLIKEINYKNKSQAGILKIISLVKKEGGIDYAVTQMNSYKDKAIAAINDFQDSEAKSALIDLVEYITVRKK